MLFEGLTDEEVIQAGQWHQQFDEKNKNNLSQVITAFKDWTKSVPNIFKEDKFGQQFDIIYHDLIPYFVLYAVGSTITDKKDPKDVDLLIITNVWVNFKEDYTKPDINDLIKRLGNGREVSVDDKVTERYDWETDCRFKIDIEHPDNSVKDVDLVYQYNVFSRDRWEYNDEYDSLQLFTIGEPQQTQKAKEYVPGRGWNFHNVPMNVWKIKDSTSKYNTQRRVQKLYF